MDVYLKYKGKRPETLKAYKNPKLRGGPYDFSKGACPVDEVDAKTILQWNPSAFEVVTNPGAEKKAEPKTPPKIETPKPVNMNVNPNSMK